MSNNNELILCEKLQKITDYLLLHSSFVANNGLLNGKMGIAIMLYRYGRCTKEVIYDDFAGELISTESIENNRGQLIPFSQIITIKRIRDYKTIQGGTSGEYVPINIEVSSNRPQALTASIKNLFADMPELDFNFSGSIISGQNIFSEMIIIFIVAILLLYFILAAQFESLSQPIIVLLEIPIDIAAALLLIKICGGSINIMTMIGLIVMSGVIINDSILKVDTINNLRAEGMELMEAIYTAGARRFKPIVMVALSSFFSTAPMLFSGGLGAELQRPMALALVGGMTVGTVVSLFFIPLAYWFIYRKHDRNHNSSYIAIAE